MAGAAPHPSLKWRTICTNAVERLCVCGMLMLDTEAGLCVVRTCGCAGVRRFAWNGEGAPVQIQRGGEGGGF
jgi:hypothetical protein